MFKKILLVIGIFIVGVLVLAATKSNSFHVERSILIKAPPSRIFDEVNDFSKWPAWSPWEKLDPNMKRTFSEGLSGPGAKYAWEGNNQVGSGKMEIIESIRPTLVKIELEFIKPFPGKSMTTFTFQLQGSNTFVTWSMEGPRPFLGKVMSVFIDCDKMIGKNYDEGLAKLKAVSEK